MARLFEFSMPALSTPNLLDQQEVDALNQMVEA